MTKKRTREAKKRLVAALAKALREQVPGKSLTEKRHKLQKRFISDTGHASRRRGAFWEAVEKARRVPGYLRGKRLTELQILFGKLSWRRFIAEMSKYGYAKTTGVLSREFSRAQKELWDAVLADYIDPLIAEGERAIDRLERTAWESEMPRATLRSLKGLLHRRASALEKIVEAAPEFRTESKARSKSGPTRGKK